jgi:exopolyphosphatase/guanosine-5'-triphosphate,3'-diphosphate pyrophosphatase
MSGQRVAGIDCGTNSVRLLIAEVDVDGGLFELARELRIVRLGQNVDRTGRLDPEAIERTRLALVDYAALIADFGVEHVRMVATSATRDATNRDDFVEMVVSVLGVAPEVITGGDEAALSFSGAVGGLSAPVSPLLVVDIGGGSTELVLGDPARSGLSRTEADGGLRAHSMDIGCVRLTERHFTDEVPSAGEVSAARSDIRLALELARIDVPIETAAGFVGVAGTVTTMAAIALGLDRYRRDAIHGSVLTAPRIHELADELLRMTRTDRAAIPVMHPGRVDVIAAGALILSEVVAATGVLTVLVSEHDILDAVTASAFDA